MADGRVTQVGLEVLGQPSPEARVTQDVIEVLQPNKVVGLVTQLVIEMLSPYVPVSGERVETFIWGPL